MKAPAGHVPTERNPVDICRPRVTDGTQGAARLAS
jgi:hypothetical protein